MGTLFNQPVRSYATASDNAIDGFIDKVKTLQKKTGWSTDQVLKMLEIKEIERRNDLSVNNGNIFDEQMAGLGELLQGTNSHLANLVDAISNQD